MTEAEAAAREICLSRLGSGRFSAAALQRGLDADLTHPVLPCGGLTRHQIEGVRFDRLTDLLASFGRWLGHVASPTHRPR